LHSAGPTGRWLLTALATLLRQRDAAGVSHPPGEVGHQSERLYDARKCCRCASSHPSAWLSAGEPGRHFLRHTTGADDHVPVQAEVQAALEQVFPRLFPALRGLHVAYRWAGMMAFTRDYLPLVDRVPHIPGVLVLG